MSHDTAPDGAPTHTTLKRTTGRRSRVSVADAGVTTAVAIRIASFTVRRRGRFTGSSWLATLTHTSRRSIVGASWEIRPRVGLDATLARNHLGSRAVQRVKIEPAIGLTGRLTAPADKSITHRALMLAAVSDGPVRIGRPLAAADTGATLAAIRACGVRVEGDLGGDLFVHGRGLRGLVAPPALDCMNAGTLMRLFTGILVGQRGDRVVLDGDESLRGRPMLRVAKPLRDMGARIWTAPGGTPPLVVGCGDVLHGVEHDLAVASAQVKSAILLAGLYAEGETWVREPAPSRDHTERMLEAAGVSLLRAGGAVGIRGPISRLRLPDLDVPGDPSSAAYAIVAGVLRGDPEVRIDGVNLNPARIGLIDVLRRMGADIKITNQREVAGEPAGDVVARRSDQLDATVVEAREVPSLIDELPLVALVGALARGVTEVRGAEELRVKETDRIETVVTALRGLGAEIEGRADGFIVRGTGSIRGGSMVASGDHRLAMLGGVAGLASTEGVSVGGFEAVEVSYPGFLADMRSIGVVAA